MGCGKPLRGRLRLPATGTTAGCTARAARFQTQMETSMRPDLHLLGSRPGSAVPCDRTAAVTDTSSVTKVAAAPRGTGRARHAAAATARWTWRCSS